MESKSAAATAASCKVGKPKDLPFKRPEKAVYRKIFVALNHLEKR